MNSLKAYEWLTQPGVKATLYNYDRHTNEALDAAVKSLRKTADEELEEKWKELEDVPFSDEDGELSLESNWWFFPAGTSRDKIWRWFDRHHSKGVGYLVNDLKCDLRD